MCLLSVFFSRSFVFVAVDWVVVFNKMCVLIT